MRAAFDHSCDAASLGWYRDRDRLWQQQQQQQEEYFELCCVSLFGPAGERG